MRHFIQQNTNQSILARRAGSTTFSRRFRQVMLVSFIVLFAPFAQTIFAFRDSGDSSPSPLVTTKELVAAQAQCEVEIRRIKFVIHELSQNSAQPPPKHLTSELELWERLQLISAQRESSLGDRYEIQRKQKQFEERKRDSQRAETDLEQPYSFTKLDNHRDALLAAQREKELLELERESEETFLTETKLQLESAEHDRRSNDSEFISSNNELAAKLLRQRTLSLIRCRTLRSEVDLHRERCEILDQGLDLSNAIVDEMQTRVDLLVENVNFSQSELDGRIARIDLFEKDIRNQLAQANQRLHDAIRRRATRAPETSRDLSEPTEPDTGFDTARDETQLLQELLTEIGGVRECWRHRFQLANEDFESDEPSTWLVDSRASMRRLGHLIEKLNLRMKHRQNALALLVRKQTTVTLDEEEQVRLAQQISDIEHLVDFYASTQVLATGGQRLYERFVDELETRLDKMSWTEFAMEVGRWASSAWSYEITAIDDQPITVSTLVCGFILLLGGYWISRLIASVIARVVLPKFGLGETAIAPVRTVIHYLLVIAFTFLALDVVNVPLTVFAFMGGAVAIGAGFGSQNLINNFISGLILIVERPIRIGDLVNVDGIEANIEKIGARSTTVRTGSNLDILVPNSKFLENNVTNWTLSDTQIRTSVTVGVAYGSPVKSVIEILEQVVRNHPKVLGNREPIVLFKDFGDNSLDFEVHFWIHMRRMMDSNRVESEVRVEIDNVFRENDISIAFPQRDVHLDLTSPIEVNLGQSGRQVSRSMPGSIRRAA